MGHKKIDNYYVSNQLLGKGTFSQVYLAYTQQYNKLAAKIIPRTNIIENNYKMFESQINLLKRCKHKHIINCLDIKKSKKNLYLFLEYCEGGNLLQYINRNKKLPEKQAMELFGQLIQGMTHLHSLNIIHRDLKPSNIMLKEGQIKIVDFGLARKYSYGQMIKTFVGTPFHMAPQILQGQKYDLKVDIYSAGTVLYQMLHGVQPFVGNNIKQILNKIENKHFNKTNNLVISEKIKILLKLMLQPNPLKRIDLKQVTTILNEYKNVQINHRISQYCAKSLHSMNYLGVLYGLSFPFHFPQNLSQKTIADMDFRLYSKVFKKIVQSQQTKSIIVKV